jgi:hypothetical protein
MIASSATNRLISLRKGSLRIADHSSCLRVGSCYRPARGTHRIRDLNDYRQRPGRPPRPGSHRRDLHRRERRRWPGRAAAQTPARNERIGPPPGRPPGLGPARALEHVAVRSQPSKRCKSAVLTAAEADAEAASERMVCLGWVGAGERDDLWGMVGGDEGNGYAAKERRPQPADRRDETVI